MKTTTWKGIEIWTDFVWKIPKVETVPPKEEEDAKFLEKDGNSNKDDIELCINNWKEESKRYVDDQFAVMRQKLKMALDKIAHLVALPETSTIGTVPTDELSTEFPNLAQNLGSFTEPTDEVGRKLYAALQGITKDRQIGKRAKSLALLGIEKQPDVTIAQGLESEAAITVLKSSDDAEKCLESVNCEPSEVEKSSSATLMTGEVENFSASSTLMAGEVENPVESSTLMAGEVGNSSVSTTLVADEVENFSAPATLIVGEVENPAESATLIADEVEKPTTSSSNDSDEADKPLASTSTDDEASRSVKQTISHLINRLTSAESPSEVFKNVDSDELRLQLERFCLELCKCTRKIVGLQQSLEEKVLDSFEKNQTIVEFFARDALLLKGHSVPRSGEQTQNQFEVLLRLVKDYIKPLKWNYDVILDDVVCCLQTKNEILDMVENFFKQDVTDKNI